MTDPPHAAVASVICELESVAITLSNASTIATCTLPRRSPRGTSAGCCRNLMWSAGFAAKLTTTVQLAVIGPVV
ncbi:MAG TPA: hypothetical protein VFS55_16655 [Dokdonella sp.]|nr:hypothetical protein [Dokdonella sp.]